MTIAINLTLKPFVIVFFLCWISFSLLIMLKPDAWIQFQNRISSNYGYQWIITDKDKFLKTHKRAGLLLLVFGLIFLIFVATDLWKTLI